MLSSDVRKQAHPDVKQALPLMLLTAHARELAAFSAHVKSTRRLFRPRSRPFSCHHSPPASQGGVPSLAGAASPAVSSHLRHSVPRNIIVPPASAPSGRGRRSASRGVAC